jgi:hypothetical protein
LDLIPMTEFHHHYDIPRNTKMIMPSQHLSRNHLIWNLQKQKDLCVHYCAWILV